MLETLSCRPITGEIPLPIRSRRSQKQCISAPQRYDRFWCLRIEGLLIHAPTISTVLSDDDFTFDSPTKWDVVTVFQSEVSKVTKTSSLSSEFSDIGSEKS